MHKIEALIRPDRFNDIKDGLVKCGVRGMTVSEVFGCGLQKGRTGVYRGKEYTIPLLPRIKLEIVVTADMVDEVIAVLLEHGRTGEVGDGKIFVLPVEHAYRIRTGDSGKNAL